MNYFFQAGEKVTVVGNPNGHDGDHVVLDKVENQRYIDPIAGAHVYLDFLPSEEPCYWLEGAIEPMADGQGQSLCVFPQNQLRKKYETGDSFEEIMSWTKEVDDPLTTFEKQYHKLSFTDLLEGID